MKTKLLLLLLVSFSVLTSYSQSKEKIKGSRNVTTEFTGIERFKRLVVTDGFKINLRQGDSTYVQIITDDNLHDVLDFDVNSDELKFRTSKRITSKKELEITVFFVDKLNTIKLSGDGEISSINTIEADSLTVIINETSRAYLTLKTSAFKLESNDKSKTELNLNTTNAVLDLKDNSNLKALINATTIDANLLQRANTTIEGDTSNLNVVADNSTVFKGTELTTTECKTILDNRAKAHLNVSENLNIEASGTSETYIYGNPKIELVKFEGTAVIRKKEK